MTKSSQLIWSALLGLVAVVGSYGLACVFPFAALAALAAVTLPARKAALLVGAAWAVNQTVGFALMHYGEGQNAAAWGIVILGAALVALAAARWAYGTETRLLASRTAAALAASVAAYQALMFAGAWALDGFASSTPEIVAMVVRNDAMWFAGLLALRLALAHRLAEPVTDRVVRQS